MFVRLPEVLLAGVPEPIPDDWVGAVAIEVVVAWNSDEVGILCNPKLAKGFDQFVSKEAYSSVRPEKARSPVKRTRSMGSSSDRSWMASTRSPIALDRA